MAGKAPGKSYRKGITLTRLADLFPDDATARAWFEEQRWPDGPFCPHCGTFNVQSDVKHKSQTHRCRECPKSRMFTVKTGTPMERSKIGYRDWAFGVYLVTTGLKGVSSMKLHRDLGVTQKTAWFMMHRLREGLKTSSEPFAGPVEVDEAFFGGLEKNKPAHKKLRAGRGPVGKTAVVAAKDRATGRVDAKVVGATDAATLQPFVIEHAQAGATVFTDDHGAYKGIPGVEHQAVKHSRRRVGGRASAHKRHRVVLVNAEARVSRHVSPCFAEAPGPLRR